jgi:penicillin V acylase-like amidase (Ntn superfamily)
MKLFLICLALIMSTQINVNACTTFCISTESELVFGKNYDWSISYGLVLVNKKNVEKTAFIINGNPAKWVSKYGSVSFNQFGREFPSGGMNESGLVIELMWLDDTKYPEPDDRPVVGGTLSWIQYQLDNSATIEDVVASDKFIRISQNSVPIHYLLADKSGKCMAVEFLDGKMVYHTGETMMVKTLTNDTYEKSVEYLKRHEGFGGTEPAKNDKGSLGRFVTACNMVKAYTPAAGKNAVDYGFEILKTVDQGEYTRWSIVYDIKNMGVYFRTSDNKKIKNIKFSELNFSCAIDVKMLDINSDLEGNVNGSMISYTYEANRKLIEDSYSNIDFLKDVKTETKDKTAKYPEILHCSDKSHLNNPSDEETHKTTLQYFLSPFGIAIGFLILSVVVLIKFKYKKPNT